MKRNFLSKSPGMLGLLATLSVIVGCSIHQTVQAQVPSPLQNPAATVITLEDVLIQRGGGEYDNNSQDFDIFFNAMKEVNFVSNMEVVGTLADSLSDITVFAPTDEAFFKLARFFGYTGNDESAAIELIKKKFAELNQYEVTNGSQNSETYKLRDLLLYHLSYGNQDSTYLQNLGGSKIVRTLLLGSEDDELLSRASKFSYFNGELIDAAPNMTDPKIIAELSDLPAINGTFHGVDRVLFPFDLLPIAPVAAANPGASKTIADVLAQSGSGFDESNQDFDILNKLLQTAELAEVFADPNANLTLFAPTDEAFIKLDELVRNNGEVYAKRQEELAYEGVIQFLEMLDQSERVKLPGVGGDAVGLLQKVLKYHASVGSQTVAAIQSATAPISTLLEGATIRSEDGKLVDQSPNFTDPQLQTGKTDITASNGVIQTIDNVLLPQLLPSAP